MNLEDMLMLGDPGLYQWSEPVIENDIPLLQKWTTGLDSIILQFRRKYGVGRAVAAPQMGIMKRLICMHIDKPVVFINPELFDLSEEMMELWDDCMSFPNLLVRVERHRKCKIRFFDLEWNEHTWELEDDLSELLQHEVDHLNGILATQRALGPTAFKWRKEPNI
jgi:peptide deformylase